MFLHEERPLCDYSYPFNPQPKNYAYCPQPDWKDTVHLGQSWDGGVAGSETELSSLPVRVSLQGRELWEQFRDLGTEMLITKTGRRMFPSCKVTVTGLNPRATYVLMMDMVPFDDNKYKWSKDCWEVSGMSEPHMPNRFFVHPDSPSLGERWMEYPVSFHKLKLTNNTLNSNGMVILHSMHKYLPRLHVVQSSGPCSSSSAGYLRFIFPEAAFFAVTAYQNTEITKLKIDNNPFAKGFRVNGLNTKRFREKDKIISNQHVDGRQQIKSSNASRPVVTDDEDDVTVSSSVDSQETECRLDNASSSTAPNPFISAFMNRGAAAQPCRQEGWAHGHRTHSSYSMHPARDYSSPVHSDARVTGFPNIASPLLSHTILGQTHTGSVGLRRPPLQSSRAGGPPRHPGLCAPDPPQHHLPPDHQVELQQQQQTEFDHPHPLPPKVSRMHLSESALRCLEKTPVSDPGSPWPLNDILNRIHSRGGASASGSPGKALQAQYERPDRELRTQPYPAALEPAGHFLPVQSMGLFQNSLMGSVGPLRDSHVHPRAPSSLEYPYKTPVPDFI